MIVNDVICLRGDDCISGGFGGGGDAGIREDTFSGGRDSKLMSSDLDKHSGVQRQD